jgi:hypothetical protein
MVINVPSKLYRYSIDAELQRSDVANFVFFRASQQAHNVE